MSVDAAPDARLSAAACPTLGDAVTAAAQRLEAAGILNPRLDARLLAAHALSVPPETALIRPERALSPEETAAVSTLVARRAERRPLAQILGVREFWSLVFNVTADTLDPRPDSEILVEAVLDAVPDRGRRVRVLDLGTGTGCLLLSILKELPGAYGVGVDKSESALRVARANAAALSLSARAAFLAGNWGSGLTGPFELIVANPPYIADTVLAGLEPEVRLFEPVLALSGGADGLMAHRALAPEVARLLAPAGVAVVEFGAGQAAAVESLYAAQGLGRLELRRDLAGRERCLALGRQTGPGGAGARAGDL